MDSYEDVEFEPDADADDEPLPSVPEPLRTLVKLQAASQIVPGLDKVLPPGLPPWMSGHS